MEKCFILNPLSVGGASSIGGFSSAQWTEVQLFYRCGLFLTLTVTLPPPAVCDQLIGPQPSGGLVEQQPSEHIVL